MSTALYRRYRPETFNEVIGQEHVTEPLMAALAAGRVTHAYLFSGPRGCGKTSSARIFARCLNCAEGPTPNPCGKCDSCLELGRGGSGSLDVVEIDAASHNGVDDARDLRERAAFAPARDRFKIFILDEAHMVTTQGFNALLKLVEEPPDHVKFIFATTEPEKVIGTIRSRTHHYPFRLVPPGTLTAYLESLCVQEGVEVGAGVLPMVVRAGGGSVRDSLSVLDQLIAGSVGGALDYERAAALLGYTSATLLDDAVAALAAQDGGALFQVVDRMVQSGHDPRRFVEDFLQRLRDLVILAVAGDAAGPALGPVPADQLAQMHEQARLLGAAAASRAADLTNAALSEMTGATSPRLQLELLCARLLIVPTARAAAPQASAPAASGGAPSQHAPRAAAPAQRAPEPARTTEAPAQRPQQAPPQNATSAPPSTPARDAEPDVNADRAPRSSTNAPQEAPARPTTPAAPPQGADLGGAAGLAAAARRATQALRAGVQPPAPEQPTVRPVGAPSGTDETLSVTQSAPNAPTSEPAPERQVEPRDAISGDSASTGSTSAPGPENETERTISEPPASSGQTPGAAEPASHGTPQADRAESAPGDTLPTESAPLESSAQPPELAPEPGGDPSPPQRSQSRAESPPSGRPGAPAREHVSPSHTPEHPTQPEPAEQPSPGEGTPSGGVDTAMIRRRWSEVLATLAQIRRTSWALVAQSATPGEVRDGVMKLIFETEGLRSAFTNGRHEENVVVALQQTLGVRVRIVAETGAAAAAVPNDEPDDEPEPEPFGGASADDETIEGSADFGVPVIERLLDGTLIAEADE